MLHNLFSRCAKISFIVALLVINCNIVKGQTYATTYFTHRPQSLYFNPAFMSKQSFYLFMPALGNMSLGIHSSGFSYEDLFNKDPLTGEMRTDTKGFLNELNDKNYIQLNVNISAFGIGFKVKDNYFSITLDADVQSKISFTKSVFDFVVNGVGMDEIMEQRVKFDTKNSKIFDINAYATLAFGWARDISERLTVGTRIKMYSGVANIKTNKSDITFSQINDSIVAYSDIDINTAFAFGSFEPKNNLITQSNSMKFHNDNSAIFSNLFKNLGFGIDLGGSYWINDKLQVSASIVDLGYIRWNSKANRLVSQDPHEPIRFAGVSTDYDFIDSDLGGYFDEIGDSLYNVLDLKVTNSGAYTTFMPTKIYLGAQYEFLPHLYVNGLYHCRFINNSMENSFMLSLATIMGKFELSVSNTMRKTFFNPGLYLAFSNTFITIQSSGNFKLKQMNGLSFAIGTNILSFRNKSDKQKVKDLQEQERIETEIQEKEQKNINEQLEQNDLIEIEKN